jgi:trehalose 6-phosphate synthase
MREPDDAASGQVQSPDDQAAAPDRDEAGRERADYGAYSLVLVASRLPVDRTESSAGEASWRPSPGGLVTALEPVMRSSGGVWIGWSGDAGPAPGPFKAGGLHLVGIGLSPEEIRDYYEGFCNATLWPLYHDVIAPPRFHRRWWDSYVAVNRYFAEEADRQAGPGATVWVHDYQLQLVPQMLRERRGDVRIGYFTHIPFPGYEIFAQLPWRRRIVEGLLGADLLGFQRRSDAANFLRACRRAAGLMTRGATVRVLASGPGEGGYSLRVPASRAERGDRGERTGLPAGMREIRAAAFPISVDSAELGEIVQRAEVRARAKEIRQVLGQPDLVLLGVDRLDYTKGILHRLRAYGELLSEGRLGSRVVLVQVASPTRERVEAYRALRDEVELTVSRINGLYGELGYPPIHYLHQSYPREEMAALYLAADVMLVTPLRDGMNLVAKEYVACRDDEAGALVLSEFAGAADELGGAFLVNPHDIEGLKDAIVRAATITPQEARRRMRAMRRRVRDHDVAHWAASFRDMLARDTSARDPLAGDPLAGDPLAGDPLAGDPLAGDLLAGDPLAGDPLADEVLAGDSPARGSLAGDPQNPWPGGGSGLSRGHLGSRSPSSQNGGERHGLHGQAPQQVPDGPRQGQAGRGPGDRRSLPRGRGPGRADRRRDPPGR